MKRNYQIRRGRILDDYIDILQAYKRFASKKDKQMFHPPILCKWWYKLIFLINGFFISYLFFPIKIGKINLSLSLPSLIRYKIYLAIDDFEENPDLRIKGFLIEHKGGIGMIVFSKYRRKGICKELIQLVKEDTPNLKLSVYKENDIAISLYKKCGFKIMEHHMVTTKNE